MKTIPTFSAAREGAQNASVTHAAMGRRSCFVIWPRERLPS
jgi:hypothetical protein